ncbi:hypothetical protein RYX36_029494, partial [Vicia faba]
PSTFCISATYVVSNYYKGCVKSHMFQIYKAKRIKGYVKVNCISDRENFEVQILF